jgi:hypothetical protein
MMIGKGNRSTLRKLAPVSLWPPQTPRACPDANPGRRGGKPATSRLSYSTAYIFLLTLGRLLPTRSLWEANHVTYDANGDPGTLQMLIRHGRLGAGCAYRRRPSDMEGVCESGYWTTTRGHPTRGSSPNWWLFRGLTSHHRNLHVANWYAGV